MTIHCPIGEMFARATPPPAETDVVAWAERNVMLPGSARSDRFVASITPWTLAPMRCIDDGVTRRMVFVKPVQAGGSVIGEVAACYWLANKSGGDVQWNWQNDDSAEGRWDKRLSRILEATPAVMRRWGVDVAEIDKSKKKRCLWLMPNQSLMVQGVHTKRRVASDSIKFQVNEEAHDEEGWISGRLASAFGRLTAYWEGVSLVISNAGRAKSELHKAFLDGTQEHWEVKCPGCGEYHEMRIRWQDDKPELGGLRYDSSKARNENGEWDYRLLAPTVRYQFPCGHEIADDQAIRKALSLGGRYGTPKNPGAPSKWRSFTLSGVSVDYIPWLDLIMEKHAALASLKRGDPEPWWRWLRERECVFTDDSERPVVGRVTLCSTKKDRNGMPGRALRTGQLDYQRGDMAKGELPYWWGLVRDWDKEGNSLLVYEGRIPTDEDAADVMRRHDVRPTCVVVDSGWAASHVYAFCLKHGFNAIKGDSAPRFAHRVPDPINPDLEVTIDRVFSVERPLHEMIGAPATKSNPYEEPMFWHYSKSGIRDRLSWLRAAQDIQWLVPSDVSQDYILHMESEELRTERDQRGFEVRTWVQVRERNDLFVLEGYSAMQADRAGIIGSAMV